MFGKIKSLAVNGAVQRVKPFILTTFFSSCKSNQSEQERPWNILVTTPVSFLVIWIFFGFSASDIYPTDPFTALSFKFRRSTFLNYIQIAHLQALSLLNCDRAGLVLSSWAASMHALNRHFDDKSSWTCEKKDDFSDIYSPDPNTVPAWLLKLKWENILTFFRWKLLFDDQNIGQHSSLSGYRYEIQNGEWERSEWKNKKEREKGMV